MPSNEYEFSLGEQPTTEGITHDPSTDFTDPVDPVIMYPAQIFELLFFTIEGTGKIVDDPRAEACASKDNEAREDKAINKEIPRLTVIKPLRLNVGNRKAKITLSGRLSSNM